MKYLILSALLVAAASMSAFATSHAAPSVGKAAPKLEEPSVAFQKICHGRYCCFWGNNGDFWTCF